jgi:hypothetical protein
MIEEIEFDLLKGPMHPSSWLSGSELVEWPDPIEHRSGGNQMRQQLTFREYFWQGNADSHLVCRAAGRVSNAAVALAARRCNYGRGA